MRAIAAIILILTSLSGLAQNPLGLSAGASMSICVLDGESGAVLFNYDADRRLTPASLTKLYTTAAALSILGETTRFPSHEIYSVGKNVVVRGMGDPTLESRYFPNNTVSRFDIRHVDTLYIYSKDFADAPHGGNRLLDDVGNYYGAAPSAFNIYDNTEVLEFNSPSRVGEKCTSPNVECFVRSYAKNADSVYICGIGDGRYASGAMPAGRKGFRVKAAMQEPEMAFVEALRKAGWTIGEVARTNNLPQGAVAVPLGSCPTILEIARETNMRSVNLFADALFLQLSKEHRWGESAAFLMNFVKDKSGSSVLLFDGSGLSVKNKTTARAMAKFLFAMSESEAFMSTLAVAGVSGTLRGFGKGTSLEGNLRGKTGSMSDVVAYSGYFEKKSGKNCVFSIIINNFEESIYEVRRSVERFLLSLSNT